MSAPAIPAAIPEPLADLLSRIVTERPLKSIAWEMNLTESSVKQYCSRLYKLIGVHSRQELTVLYWRDGRFR